MIEVDGARLACRVSGSGPPLLAPKCNCSWDPGFEAFMAEQFGVIVGSPRDFGPSGQTYVQTARNGDGYVVERREGNAEHHFSTQVADMRMAHRLLTGWAFGVPGWDDGVSWTPVRL